MIQAAERLKVRLMVWMRWTLSPQQKLQSIRLFEATEDDSAWQLLRASEHLPEAHLQAELFSQVMEESFHAEEFRKVYRELSGKKLDRLFSEKKPLYPASQAKSIFAYCLIGEASAAERFEHLAACLKDGALKRALQRILSDEVGHIHKAQEILQTLEIAPPELKKKLVQIRFRRGLEKWLRMGRQITDLVSELFLAVFYFSIAGVFSVLLKWGRKS